MPNNTSTAVSKKSHRMRSAFWIALIVILLVEMTVYGLRHELVRDHWNKFILNEHRLIDLPRDYDYIVMGNSIHKTGIIAPQVSPDLLCLGLAGAKPLAHYMLFKRYLKKHAAPKVIFYYLDLEDARDSMNVIARYYMSLGEVIEYGPDMRSSELWAYYTHFFSTLDYRRVRLSTQDRKDYSGTNKEFVQALLQGQGYIEGPFAQVSIAEDFFRQDKTHPRLRQRAPSLDKRDIKYLMRFVDLAQRNGSRVVFLSLVVPKELAAFFEVSGFAPQHRKVWEELRQTLPDVSFPENSIDVMDNSFFGDYQHLNLKGAQAYTKYFKSEIFELAVKGMEN